MYALWIKFVLTNSCCGTKFDAYCYMVLLNLMHGTSHVEVDSYDLLMGLTLIFSEEH